MRYQYLRDRPIKSRPRNLLPDYSVEYLRGWYLIIFLCVLLLIVLNGTIAGIIQHNWWAILGVIIACVGYLAVFTSLCSGMISTNIGTYFRETEPFRYWITTGIITIMVGLFCVAVWVI
jgi:hypothetical protein